MSPGTRFLREALAALALALAAGALVHASTPVLGAGVAMRAAVALLSLFYVLRSVFRSRARVGGPSLVLLWLVVATLAWLLEPSPLVYAGLHTGMIGLARTLLDRPEPVAAALDFALLGMALVLAAAALTRTGNFGLACWCFLLVQALHVALPNRWPSSISARDGRNVDDPTARFTRAQHTAEAALRRAASR